MRNNYVNLAILGGCWVVGIIAGKGVYKPIRESLNKKSKSSRDSFESEDITVEEVEANI